VNRRWWIVALLFLSTVLNYVDRQTLSVLAPTIQRDLHLSDLDYSRVVQLFLLAYTMAYLVAGRVTDWLGTRWSMVLFLGWWSLSNLLTGFARSLRELGSFRFLLGLGEAGNYTAAPKAVGEWFAPQERGLAVGIYTAGAMIGATVAPPLIAWLGGSYGWRAAFFVTGIIGFAWLVPWILVCRKGPLAASTRLESASGTHVLRLVLADRRMWLLTFARMLSDPVWYFYLFWFPKYLMDARGRTLAQVGQIVWVVYVAADLGSLLGGSSSGALIRRGLDPVGARLRIMTLSALVAPVGCLIAIGVPLPIVLVLSAVVSFMHLTWQVTMGALIVDLFSENTMATAFGLIAAGSGFGGMLSTSAIAWLVTHISYRPVFLLMALLHPLALLLARQVTSDSVAQRAFSPAGG
jgi:ACS family hexuronate transporter-like MFS transporter